MEGRRPSPFVGPLELVDSSSDDDFEEEMIEAAALAVVGNNRALLLAMESEEEEEAVDHRTLKRAKRTIYKHSEALHCIKRDYTGPTPIFNDKQFDMMFRISKTRFQCIMEDFGAAGLKYYLNTTDAAGKEGASFEARLLLPLKTLAYGVAPHTFCDYFQMSPGFARDCCKKFDKSMLEVYQKEYLRLPTPEDLKAIYKLHKSVHKVDGMFGSLDCCHTTWKNCPKAWQGSYKGKEKKSTIVLEAICDHHLWFWHISYGYAGTLNDKNILNLSPFLGSLVNGKFVELEGEAGVIPFQVHDEEFNKLFVLVDGIYPRYSRFVRGITEPISDLEKSYTGWQEAARKDIERAFGVLQCMFQWFARPIHMMNLKNIANRVGCCLILHNMCVSARIMGDCRATYNPAASLEEDLPPDIENPPDQQQVQAQDDQQHQAEEEEEEAHQPIDDLEEDSAGIGISRAPDSVKLLVLNNKQAWQDLDNMYEHARLTKCIMLLKKKWKRKP